MDSLRSTRRQTQPAAYRRGDTTIPKSGYGSPPLSALRIAMPAIASRPDTSTEASQVAGILHYVIAAKTALPYFEAFA
jgi:hypothetical protein